VRSRSHAYTQAFKPTKTSSSCGFVCPGVELTQFRKLSYRTVRSFPCGQRRGRTAVDGDVIKWDGISALLTCRSWNNAAQSALWSADGQLLQCSEVGDSRRHVWCARVSIVSGSVMDLHMDAHVSPCGGPHDMLVHTLQFRPPQPLYFVRVCAWVCLWVWVCGCAGVKYGNERAFSV